MSDFDYDPFEVKLTTIRLSDPFSVKLMTAILKRHGYHVEPPTSRRKTSLRVRISDQDYETEIEPTYKALSERVFPIFHKAIDAVVANLEDDEKLSDEDLYKLVFEQ